MPTLREYFDAESAVYLRKLGDVVDAANGRFDGAELHRLARALRGTAQLAREEHVYRAALGLESAARAIAGRAATLEEPARDRLRKAIASLRDLTADSADDTEREPRVSAVLEACRMLCDDAATTEAAEQPAVDTDGFRREFRDYVAQEIEDVARALDESLAAFANDPMDREALRTVLRRHRALLGAARLDEVKVVADTLRAVEDIAGVISRINTPVKKEWLDVFRCARDVLRTAGAPLRRGEDPVSTPALSRLRTLREELLDRYGAADTDSEPAPDAVPAPGPNPPASRLVDIDALCYRGQAALRRALELRPRLEQALRDEPRSRAALDELFDLIRLGLE